MKNCTMEIKHSCQCPECLSVLGLDEAEVNMIENTRQMEIVCPACKETVLVDSGDE